MAKLEFKMESGYSVKISSDSPNIISVVRELTKCSFTDRVFDYQTKSSQFRKTEKYFCKKRGNSITVKRGMAEIVFYSLQSDKFNVNNLPEPLTEVIVCEKLQWLWRLGDSAPETFIRLSEKWKDIYLSNPKGAERGEMQLSDVTHICTESSGLIDLFTGYGKTEVMLGVSESFLDMDEYKHGNLLIFTYGNKVRDEVYLRAKHYGLNVTKDFDVNNRINIINVSAFVRTKAFQTNPDIANWLENVIMIQADEAHHMSAETWHSMVERCDPLFVYGYSASADVNEGKSTERGFITADCGDPKLLAVLEVTGFSIISRELPTPVNIFRISSEIGNEATISGLREGTYAQSVIDYWIQDYNAALLIKNIYTKILKKDKICFITTRTVEPAAIMITNLNKLGLRAVLWTGQLSLLPDGKGGVTEASLSLEELKLMSERNEFDILMSTSIAVEGIDLRNLGSVIPLVDRSFKMVVQPTGRAAREEEVDLVFIFDKVNGMLTSQMKKKYSMAKNRFNVTSNKSFTQTQLANMS